ncbi:hypothetical protein DEO23_14940 [Brachybacterium endophyticum]|uniref:Uncharacterized protein n=1 Tax=Brachybacterium endophyticum TaxID=2182385 RepID=A0A2U2RGT8_9MICO|nr:hypothetical protein [Brachybacterium endophyticum]PWH05089.1 hypothetical protein DEO23_14940 [Brachybacterium endophyticum]
MSKNASGTAVPPISPVLHWLRIVSGAAGLLVVVQALLGFGLLGNLGALFPVHQGIGYLILLATVVAAVFAVLWSRAGGNTGMMMHAIAVAVLALIQIGIAETGVIWLHVVVGLLILVAAVALATLSLRSGGSSRPRRRSASASA